MPRDKKENDLFCHPLRMVPLNQTDSKRIYLNNPETPYADARAEARASMDPNDQGNE